MTSMLQIWYNRWKTRAETLETQLRVIRRERDAMRKAREADLRMAWTIGACFGKEFHNQSADDYRNRSLGMTANECLGITPYRQER